MSYGFKFINDNNETVLDDRNVKPWLITGPYIGANWKTEELPVTPGTTDYWNEFLAMGYYPPRKNGQPEVWRLYEIHYVAPSIVNCFAVFTLPEVGGIWYTNGKNGAVVLQGASTLHQIPLANNATYPSVSIIAAVPESWLISATTEEILSAVPKVYFYSADPIPNSSKGQGYGMQIFKEDSTCVFDTDKKHIRPGSYSFMNLQSPAIPTGIDAEGGYNPTVYPTNISGYTGTPSNLAFSLTTSVYAEMGALPFGSGNPNWVQAVFCRIFYARVGTTLYTANIATAYHTWEKPATDTLNTGSVYVLGTDVASSNLGPAFDTYFSKVLVLDTTGFDTPYTPIQFPSSYKITSGQYYGTSTTAKSTFIEKDWVVSSDFSTASASNTIIRFSIMAFNVPDGALSYTLSGTGITTGDIDSIYLNGVLTALSLTGSVNISGGLGYIDVVLKEDWAIEGTENLTLTLGGNKGTITVSITEKKYYTSPSISGANYIDGVPWVSESGTYSIQIVTHNVAAGTTIPYMLLATSGTFNASDLVSGSITGNLTVGTLTSNQGIASGSITIKADNLTEATQEAFSVSLLFPGDSSYTTVIPTVYVTDSSQNPVPTYSIRYYSSSQGRNITGGYETVTEGQTLTFDIVTTNVPNGTRVYPFLASGNMSAADFVLPSTWYDPANPDVLLGVLVNNNFAQFTVAIKNDILTEGTETFYPFLSSVNSVSGASSHVLWTWTDGWFSVSDTSKGTETYAVTTNSSYVTESDTLQAQFTVSALTSTPVVWVLTGISTTDIQSMYYMLPGGGTEALTVSTTGVFSFDATKSKTLAIQIKQDGSIEGTETLRVALHTVAWDGDLVAYKDIPVYDTSGPYYSIWSDYDDSTVNEGTTVRYYVSANVPNNTYLYWRNSGTSTSNDFTDGNNTGGVLIVSNSGWFDRAIRNDYTTESGYETIIMNLKLGDEFGPTVATAPTVYINDTSKTITATITPTVTSVNEGAVVRWDIVTTNVPDNTYLYWTNVGTTVAADFNDAYGNTNFGSVLIQSNQGWFARQLSSDLTTEGSETIIMRLLRDGNGADGTLLVTSATVTVVDSSIPRNEVVTVSPSTVTFNSGTALSVSGGQPSDTVQWSVNNTKYDGIFYLDANGNASNATAGAGFAPGSYTLYLYFQATGHYRNVSWTVVANNEIVSVSPTSYAYGTGTTLTITGGVPNEQVNWSLNNYNYDQTSYLNSSGSLSSLIGTTSEVGSWTLYFQFVTSGHTRSVSWTVTAANPAAGTLLSTYCSGTTKYGTYANGSGGTYNQVIATNSTDCGYVAPTLTVSGWSYSSNAGAYYDVWTTPAAGYDGLRVRGGGRQSINEYVSRSFSVNIACTLNIHLNTSTETFNDFGEVWVDSVRYLRSSGTTESGYIGVPLSAGSHTVKLVYTKNGSINGGNDEVFTEYNIS